MSKGKLTAKELDVLEGLLERAIEHEQFGVGAMVGSFVQVPSGEFGLELDTDVPDGFNSFTTYENIGGVLNTGENISVTMDYTGLKWVWARVQGARGGKKRKLTSEDAKKMAAKRHAR